MLSACLVAVASAACSSTGHGHLITAGDVHLVAPSGWHRIQAAEDGPVIDPRTLLVVGTKGVGPRRSQCQIAAYRVQPSGAVVVVVGWKSIRSSGGGRIAPGRSPLKRLSSVRRPSFECFAGRGAAALVLLGGHPYQVNVMVGDHASAQRVSEALAVARSFDVVR